LFDFAKNGAFVAIIAEGLIGISLAWDRVLLKKPRDKKLVQLCKANDRDSAE
jgi:hypothetical protein